MAQPEVQQLVITATESQAEASTVITKPPATATQPQLLSAHEYLLVEDTNADGAPAHLAQLFAKYDASTLTQAEALFLLAFLIALETGYVPLAYLNSQQLKLTPTQPAASFHAANCKQITGEKQPPAYTKDMLATCFSMPLQQFVRFYGRKPLELLQVTMLAILTGDVLLFTLTPYATDELQGISTALPVARYVHNTDVQPIYRRFHNLPELSQRLRDELFVAMRVQQLNCLHIGPYAGLNGLPSELYDRIMDLLKRKDRTAFASLNQRLHAYCIHSKYWRKAKKLTFNIATVSAVQTDENEDPGD